MERAERERLLSQLRADAARIADHFGLQYSAIEAEHPRVKSRYGVCYDTGLVKIRLNHAKTGRPLKYSSLIDTLCHELAHLRHFDHSPAFKRFFLKLLAWARKEGIYRPSPRSPRASGRRFSGPSGVVAPPPPPRRNGVAVFGAPRSSGRADGQLPWEASGRAPAQPARADGAPAASTSPRRPGLATAPSTAPSPSAKTPPLSAAKPTSEALPLWEAVSSAPASKRAGRAHPRPAPSSGGRRGARPAPGKQLTLFE